MSVKRLDGRDGLIVRGDKYLEIPKGPTSTRPTEGTGARTGMIRFNTDSNIYEGYNGSSWVALVSGLWTVLDAETTSSYVASAGEQILVDTSAAPAPIKIILPESAVPGDSVRVADSGFAGANAQSHIIIGTYPNDDPNQTPTFSYTIQNSNTEGTFVYGTVDGSTLWTKIDVETFIANGSTKLQIANEDGDAVLSNGNLVLSDGGLFINGANQEITISDGDLNVAANRTVNVGTTILSNDSLVVPKISGLTGTPVADGEGISFGFLKDEVIQHLIKADNLGDSLIMFGSAPNQTIDVRYKSLGGLSYDANGLGINFDNLTLSGTAPSGSDFVLMNVGGSLVKVTKDSLLGGLGAPRTFRGTVVLSEGGDNGNASDGSSLSPTGSNGTLNAGDEYAVTNSVTSNGITGTNIPFAAGDSIIWTGTSWTWLQQTSITFPVSSVFGRTGNITASLGDYQASQISYVVTPSNEAVVTPHLQGAVSELDLYKASRTDDNIFLGENTFNAGVDFNSTTNFDGSSTFRSDVFAVDDLYVTGVTSRLYLNDYGKDQLSLRFGATQTGFWGDDVGFKNLGVAAKGETVAVFHNQSGVTSGLILEETPTNTSAPTIMIVNSQSDTLPRTADVYIENNLPNISLKNIGDTNLVSLEMSPGSTVETFAVRTRSNTSNSLGNKVHDLFQVSSLKFEVYSQFLALDGTDEEPSISFKNAKDVGFTSTEVNTPGLNNQLHIVANGGKKITINGDYYDNNTKNYNSSVVFEGTGSIKVPNGPTDQRPLNPGTGAIRFNDTLGQFEGYYGGKWKSLSDLGGSSSGRVEWFLRNADSVLNENFGYLIDTTNTSVVCTLPGDPTPNDFVWIADYSGTADKNPIVVKSSDKPGQPGVPDDPIMGKFSDIEINSKNASIQFVYVDANIGWKIVDGIGEDDFYVTQWSNPQSTNFTAEAFGSYMVDTSSNEVIIQLPELPALAQDKLDYRNTHVRFADYTGTARTNNIRIQGNGTNIQGSTDDFVVSTNNASVTFTYIDETQGWKLTSGNGSGESSTLVWELVDAELTPTLSAVNGEAYMIDTSINPCTVELPVNPNFNDTIYIMDHKGTASVNNIVLDSQGKLLFGTLDNININLDRASITVTYLGDLDSEGWVITDGIGEGGGGGQSKDDWTVVTTDFGAIVGGDYQVDTSTQSITVTLPSNPVTNDMIKISDYSGNCKNNNIVVVPSGGDKIMFVPDDLVIDMNFATVELTYIDDIVGWKITDGIGEGGSSGLSQNWQVINQNTQISGGSAVMVDTRTSSIQLQLPSSPQPNSTIFISDYYGTASDNNITIVAIDGSPIMGDNNPLTNALIMDLDNLTIQLTYIDGTVGWKIVDGIGEGGTGTGNVLQPLNELVVLTSGQQTVTFTNISDVTRSVFFVNGIKLYPPMNGFPGDYVINGTNQIVLVNTYPVGAQLLGTQNDSESTDPTIWDFSTIEEEGLLATGQNVITSSQVSFLMPYSIYVNGLRLAPSQKTVLSANQIRLNSTFPNGSIYVLVQNDPTGRI